MDAARVAKDRLRARRELWRHVKETGELPGAAEEAAAAERRRRRVYWWTVDEGDGA